MTRIELPEFTRPIVNDISPYEPGKPISEVQREYGLKDVIKLASNENPLGPSPKAIEAIRSVLTDLHRYPDGAGYYLKEKLSVRLAVPPEWIVLGNGSTELVELVTEAFVGEGDEAVIGRYEFFKYRIAVQLMNGCTVWAEMPDLQYDVDEFLYKISPLTKVLFVANPNNPTGTMMNAAQADRLMERIPENIVTVFDEAYYDYRDVVNYPDIMKYVRSGRNVVIMRTFSKSYGLAGLRIGYAITSPAIAQAMNTVREAFNVNTLGQVGAIAALDDHEFLKRGVELNEVGKQYYYRELTRLGLDYIPTGANFVLMKTRILGRELFQRLLKRGVIIRPVDGYGLSEYVRVSIGLPEENARFIDELALVLDI